MSEIELKFLLDEPTSRELWAQVTASKLAKGHPTTKTLRSIYLDTPEHALKKAGIALRLRRDGRRWVQTVKTNAELHGGLSQVGEVENPAPGGRPCPEAIPEAAIREEVLHLLNGTPLQPVCETVIKRSAGELLLADGTRAELAVDTGEIRAGERSAEFCEVEIEPVEGNPGGLFDITHALFPKGGLRFSRLSKAARGYLLAEEGRIDFPLCPQNAKGVAIDPAQTAELAARDILRECLDQIAANILAVRKVDDAEGPHQLRIGLRRLRSAFSVFSLLQSPEMERLNGEARWLGQEVGHLRDLDVVANDIVGRDAKSHPDEPGLAALSEALPRRTTELRDHLRKLLVEARVQAFLIDLARFVETRGWLVPQDFGQTERLAAPIGELSGQALKKRWKKVVKHAHGIETLTAEQRHELRKELKKLRYVVEFFSPLYPAKRVDPFLKRLKGLQTVFGDLNDAAIVRATLTEAEVFSADNPAAQRAAGWVLGSSQARAEVSWTRATALWRSLKKARPFWK
ncbi:CHAD domain-containing protein [Mesorhizobium sp. M00.F.Ca.ET.216.01.1.1]|uniref:CYTH and CHAD domain-containing protein n=1 Tax=Mesorhizobium sp. M00.F.Ca.ET.216.01.1.1 TaxID=2500528 RepID=UPI000FD915AA|nr:CHAD domain-containing protein [Mesorhizobium sp. M00.F.Ca.ET.216.01.1.1]TGQ32425.1 CYTH and CHAD domain-containing protein [Mesorhizobium sp. M00.F.Ca.ET.216.01.1.1]